MLSAALFSVPLLFASNSAVQATSASVSQWQALNISVGGRLHKGTPLALPCFSNYNGISSAVDTSACAAVESGYTDATFRSDNFGAFMQPQWETCQNTNQGCLLGTGSANASCLQGSIAPYYIDVTNASDVQAAYLFSAATGVPLSIKNSGHDYKGRSSLQGSLGLWTRHLNSMSFNASFTPQGCSTSYRAITVGAGVSFQDAYQFADENNSTLIGGYSGSVGAAGGWAMGGGHSVLSPVYGLGVDRMLQYKIVTPDGKLRIANACQNQDLFFALRGGGGGTFGVVLEATHHVEPRMPLQVAAMSFTGTALNMEEFYEILVNNTAQWASEGWGGHIYGTTAIYVNPLISLADAQDSMQQLSSFIEAQGGNASVVEVDSYWEFFQQYILSVEVPVGVEIVVGSRLISKDVFNTAGGRNQLVDILLEIVEQGEMEAYIPVVAPVLYNATQATSVTPAWRSSYWHFTAATYWAANASQANIAAAYSLVHNITETLTELSPDTGAYINEGDVYQSNYTSAYWGNNYAELLSIKKKYDPAGLLTCWQCVGWSGPSASTSSCYLPAPN